MKILFVHNKYKFYGGEDATLEAEARLLEQKGHEVQIVQFDNKEIDGVFAKIKTGLASFYNFHSARLIENAIRSFVPDVVHVHNLFFTASPSVILKAYELKVPVVMTIHNYRLVCANALLLRDNKVCELCVSKIFPLDGIRYKCYRSSYIESALVTSITSIHKIISTWKKKVSHFIILADFAKEKLQRSSLRLPAEKISIKPNFIFDLNNSFGERKDYFLFVGRLATEKGIYLLLDCFEKNSNYKLIIAGDGPEKENLLNKTKTTENIQYVGQLPKNKILELMAQSRALIFPSIWYEGLPTTIIEAFATGTPVIASRLGAMSEMIRDSYNGYHFEPGNAEELKMNLVKMSAAGEELYRQARQTYEENYHPEVHYKRIISIYEKAIENRKSEG